MATTSRSAALLALSLGLSACTQVVPAPPPPAAPRIERFEAAMQVINAGQEVRLTFSTVGATRVELMDDEGRAIQLEGDVAEGGTLVAPTRTTFYVLRARGEGGTTSAFLQIAVNQPLREAFLIAVPPELEAGQSGQLLWSAPGAAAVTLTERGEAPVMLSGTSGIVSIAPAASTGYRLSAQGVSGTPPVDAVVEIRVRPGISAFAYEATNGVRVGEPLVFTWQTAGATRVVLSERSLGQLTEATEPAGVANGTFTATLPAMLSSGLPVGDGFPLHFTLMATSGSDVTTRELPAVVGNLPTIERLTAPQAVTAGKGFLLSWKTLNASKVTVLLGGLPVFETLSSQPARAADGSVTLPGPAADSDYVLVASDERGREARQTIRVRVVQPPTITSFTVPATVSAPGSQVMAQWTTTNAETVTLRLDQGPTLTRVTAPSQVAQGSASFLLGSTAWVSLEATNAAGDSATETRQVRVSGGAVFVTPTPALRSTTGTATLEWQLSALNVTEVLGLATPGPTVVTSSTAFIDLATSATATALTFTDTDDGSTKLPDLGGFGFPLVGQLQRQFWVSANGFLTFSQPPALSSNADIGSSTNTTQSIVAALWDDLEVGTGSVLFELQTNTSGERVLIVQWEKVRLYNSTSTEFTFQAQLFETGQVTLVYKTLTGSVTSATVGVKASYEEARQAYQYNTTGGPVVADVELTFFKAALPDGTLPVSRASSRRIGFLARAPTGLMALGAEVRTVAVDDLAITEAMPFPEGSVASTGQWIELRNNLTTPLDIDGIGVLSEGSTPDGGYLLPQRVLMPGEFLVIGQSTDTLQSGGAPVSFVMTDVPLGTQDSVRLVVQNTAIASLSWDGGTVAESIFRPEGLLLASGATATCARTRTFGPNGAYGTPGAANESCAPYVISRVDAGYVDIATGSTELLASADDYSGRGTVTLPAPFTYFGQSQTTVQLSLAAGFFAFTGTPLSSAYVSNPAAPSTTEPNGVVAPFWDELVRNSGSDGDGAVFMKRLADRTIISWQDFRVYADFDSHIYFQVHLVDPDIIEFHYGSMETGSTSASNLAKHRGSTATLWLEKQDGSLAVPFSVNQERVSSFMNGVRFTPAP